MASVSKRGWAHKGETKTAWIVRYFDRKGVHRQKTFQRKKEADAFRSKVEIDVAADLHIADADTRTVKVVVNEFLKAQDARLLDGRIGRGRLYNLELTTRVSIVPYLGGLRIDRITSADLDGFYRAMCQTDKLAPKTAKSRVHVLKMICDFAMREGYLKNHGVIEALAQLKGVQYRPIRTFTKDELLAVLHALETRKPSKTPRNHLLLKCSVHLATFCGLRFGEIMGLTRAYLDFAARVIRVRHGLTGFDELKDPKTRSGVRDVPMPNHIAQMLGEWMTSHFVENERDLLFRTISGGRVTACNFHAHEWGPLLQKAGLYKEGDNLHFHALRHFAASWMIAGGVSLMEVASLLGHRTFNTTLQTYAHAISGGHGRGEMMDRLSAGLLQDRSARTIEGGLVSPEPA